VEEPKATGPDPTDRKHRGTFAAPLWQRVEDLAGDRTKTSVALFGFLILKVLLVARGDLLTSLAVVNSAGIVAVVVGVILSAMPILAALSMAYVIYWWISGTGRPRASTQGAVIVGTIALSGWFSPWFLFVPTLAFALLVGAFDRWDAPHRTAARTIRGSRWAVRPSRKQRGFGTGAMVLAASLMALAIGGSLFTMWLPHERVVVEGQPRPIVGYVLDNSDGWMTVLTSGARRVDRFKEDSVTSRTLCRGSDFHESSIQWIARVSGGGFTYLPPCLNSAKTPSVSY
jgi:hypothetical protein